MFILSLFFALTTSAHALSVPLNDGYVTDEVQVLSIAEEQGIEARLRNYKETTSNEVALLIIPSLAGESDNDFATKVLREWGIGDAKKNNGVLLLHVYEDRRVYITVGYGLEGALPDLVLDGIIGKDIVPSFQAGNYAAGYSAAIDSLQKHIASEYTVDRYTPAFAHWDTLLFFLFLFLEPFAALLGRTREWWLGGIFGFVAGLCLVLLYRWWITIPLLCILGLLFDFIVSKMYRNSGRSGSVPYRFRPTYSSGRSGGFGGFGGGRSGGAGAGRSY